MNLLTDGIASGAVIKTALSRKLTLDGNTAAYPVYKIRLDILFFNDQNDRIASWISEYRTKNGGASVNLSDKEAYNAIIEDFIVKSNPSEIKKTQSNIELVDQREPGVVLLDGRVIDGNRRFSCLRRLKEKNDRFNYFEAIILERDIENNAKQIKMLELSVQHGEESRVGYNPIDRLAGIYNDIIKTKLLSPAEYAKYSGESELETKKRIELAELLVEFLDFINVPLQFHVARDMGIFDSISELPALIRKCRSDDDAQSMKHIVFTNLLMRSEGYMRQIVRDCKKIVGTEYQDEFFEEQLEIAERVIDALPPTEQMSDRLIRDEIRADESIVQELARSMDKTMTKVKKTEVRNQPIKLAEKATEFLESIDMNILKKMSDSDVQRMLRQLKLLEEAALQVRGGLE